MVLMVSLGGWKIRSAGTRIRSAARLKRYGSAWHAVYASAWFAGLSWWWAALTFLSVGIVGFLMMTLLEGISATGSQRVTYR